MISDGAGVQLEVLGIVEALELHPADDIEAHHTPPSSLLAPKSSSSSPFRTHQAHSPNLVNPVVSPHEKELICFCHVLRCLVKLFFLFLVLFLLLFLLLFFFLFCCLFCFSLSFSLCFSISFFFLFLFLFKRKENS